MNSVDGTAAQLAVGNAFDPLEEDTASFLVVVIDLHGEGWTRHASVPFWDVMASLMVLLNAHLALDSANELAVIGYNGAGARLLYTTALDDLPERPKSADPVELQGTMFRQFKNLDTQVLARIRGQINEAASLPAAGFTSVAGPLSLGLSYLNRQIRETPSLRGHILVVSAAENDAASKYIATMNTIFTAQKLRVPLDVANFGPPKSFLQQAADFTGGSYLEIRARDAGGLVQFFTSVYLLEPSVRQYVNIPTKPDVDFSAVCFLTKKVVEIGYVCSVCLCIMEQIPANQQCPVCKTHYETNALRD